MSINRMTAIKKFMGTERPVEFAELKDLINNDKDGFNWMAEQCAKALGEELEVK